MPRQWRRILSLLQDFCCCIRHVEQVHSLVAKSGCIVNHFIASRMLQSSLRIGDLQYGRSLFDEMDDPENPFLWNTIIKAYCKSLFPFESLRLYNRMIRLCIKPDLFTYPFVLNSCAKASSESETVSGNDHTASLFLKGAEIHCRIVKCGFEEDGFIQNSLIFMYSICGSRVDLARQVFDEMPLRTFVSWNTMIAAYDRCKDVQSAISLQEAMPTRDVVSWNNMITRLVKANRILAARQAFDKMPERDAVSWNAMIAGYVQRKRYAESLKLFRKMHGSGVEPTEITLITVLGACAESGELEFGKWVHDYLRDKGFKVEGFMGNALMDMYAKCGSLESARHVFDQMAMKHVSTWNTMIVGLAVHGQSERALELFIEMERAQVQPNRVTFLGLLTACSHKGILDKARQFFRSMVEDHGIKPDIKHFGCMVDLYCRLGMLEEANKVIDSMSVEPNCIVWRTLLSACRSERGVNVELAEKAVRGLAQLGPLRDMDYVLLSNIYAEADMWKDVMDARSLMLDSRVMKKPGCSQIQVAGVA